MRFFGAGVETRMPLFKNCKQLNRLGVSFSRTLKILLSLPTLETARRPFFCLAGYLN